MSGCGSGGICGAFLGRSHGRRWKRDSVFPVRWLRLLLHYETRVPLSVALSFLVHLLVVVNGIMEHFSGERFVCDCRCRHEVVAPTGSFLSGAIH